VVNSVLSNDEILANKWSIYPNPVEGELVIATGNLEDKSLGLIIYNVNGEQLMSFDAVVENGYLRISVEELSSGVYFIELISNEGRSFNTMLKEN
ncbi:MAG: T9SS type A sorting domain-containing protein, partial [Bacteroidota bacterium]